MSKVVDLDARRWLRDAMQALAKRFPRLTKPESQARAGKWLAASSEYSEDERDSTDAEK